MGLQTGPRVAFAFGLTFAAGVATILGGLIIASERLVKFACPRTLAIGLGLSSGVMLYISFAEILHESVEDFQEGLKDFYPNNECHSTCQGHAKLFSTLSFLFGWAVVYALDYLVHKLDPDTHHDLDVDVLHQLRESFHGQHHHDHHLALPKKSNLPGEEKFIEIETPSIDAPSRISCPSPRQEAVAGALKLNASAQRSLSRSGLITALAIGIHNIPEGIATFAAAMQGNGFGLALCLGIALHNIPEGLAVAAPVFFATGSRWKGVLWSAISALALPLGGVIAWVILGEDRNLCVDGGLFGMVSGLMVCIVLRELLPTARVYAPNSEIVMISVVTGIMVMSLSLILIKYSGLE